MPSERVDTGIEVLDTDLRDLFEANTAKRRQEIKAAIVNSSLSEEELFKTVPRAILRLAVALREPRSYKSLVERARKESHPQLEKAREIVEQHFVDILKHPAVLPQLTPSEDGGASVQLESLNVITGVSHIPYWIGFPPKLRPSARLAFVGLEERILLDSTFDWEDFLYLGSSLLEILADNMEAGKELAEREMVEIPYGKQMAQRLVEIEEHLNRIKKLANLYGFQTPTSEQAAEGIASKSG